MLVELLRAKRKSADRDDDSEDAHPGIKRTRLDDRDHVPLPPLYHHVAGAPICYLATTASATVEDPYDWTCEVCREQVASDDPAPRQHCAAHSADVCERCHAACAAAGQFEIEPMLDDEHEDEQEEEEEEEEEPKRKYLPSPPPLSLPPALVLPRYLRLRLPRHPPQACRMMCCKRWSRK